MAVIQWRSGVNLVQYDVDSNLVSILDAGGSVLDGPRVPTSEELAVYNERFVIPEEEGVLQLKSQLAATLDALRSVTEDSTVTQQEIATVIPVVFPALYSFRDADYTDPDTLKLVILVLAQVNLALFTIITSGSQMSASVLSNITRIQENVDNILLRLDVIEGG